MEVPIGPTRGYAWFPIWMGATPDRAAIDDANKMVTEFLNEALKKYRSIAKNWWCSASARAA